MIPILRIRKDDRGTLRLAIKTHRRGTYQPVDRWWGALQLRRKMVRLSKESEQFQEELSLQRQPTTT